MLLSTALVIIAALAFLAYTSRADQFNQVSWRGSAWAHIVITVAIVMDILSHML